MSEHRDAPPSFREMVRVFGRIGLLSFGGPAGQIALMHRELVEERGWLDERKCVMESLTAIRRAGADIVLTYFARQVGQWLAGEAC